MSRLREINVVAVPRCEEWTAARLPQGAPPMALPWWPVMGHVLMSEGSLQHVWGGSWC